MKPDQKQQAKHLYFNTKRSFKEIADTVGVDVRTLYRWARSESWGKMKQAALVAPAIAVDNLFFQLMQLQKHIAAGKQQFPTPQEIETSRKIISCINQMNKYIGLGMNMRLKGSFVDYVQEQDLDFAMKLTQYSDEFFVDECVEYKPQPWHSILQARWQEDPIDFGLDEKEEKDGHCVEPQMPVSDLSPVGDISQNSEIQIIENEQLTAENTDEQNNQATDISVRSEHFEPLEKSDYLPNGVMWFGENRVYDPRINKERSIRPDEIGQYARMGVTEEWLAGPYTPIRP